MRSFLFVLALAALLTTAIACSSTPAPTPTLRPPPPTSAPPPPAPTAVPPVIATPVPQPTAAPAQPTETSAPTTGGPTATTAAAPTAAPTSEAAASATIPAPSPTTAGPAAPSGPPGLYVTGMRLDPTQPAHGQNISFYVTFFNSATGDQNVRWQVYVFKADNPTRRNNETSILQTAFQPGTIELQSPGHFAFGSTGNACDFFYAVVDQLDINSKGTDLTKPDGSAFQKGFSICQ